MSTSELHVDNSKCGGRTSTIRERLNELPGVAPTSAHVEADTVRVMHDVINGRT